MEVWPSGETFNRVYRHILDFENDCFAKMQQEATAGDGKSFPPKVRRVVLDGPVLFHGFDQMGCVIREFASQNVYLLEGTDLLNSLNGLTCDLLHPSTEAHTLMAENLAAQLRSLLPILKQNT